MVATQLILSKRHMTHEPPTVLNVSPTTRVRYSLGGSGPGSCDDPDAGDLPGKPSEGCEKTHRLLDSGSSPAVFDGELLARSQLSANAADGWEATLSRSSKRLSLRLPPPLPAPT